MRKNLHDRILKSEHKKQHISTIHKSCPKTYISDSPNLLKKKKKTYHLKLIVIKILRRLYYINIIY